MINQQLILLSAILASFSLVDATSDRQICRQVDDLLKLVPRDLIEIESVDHDAVYRWLLDHKKQTERTNYYLDYLVSLTLDPSGDCDDEFRDKTQLFLPLIEGDRARSSFVQYFKYHALKRVEYCLSHQDEEWSLRSKWVTEWALDRFFKDAFGLSKRASERKLLERVSKFDLISSDFDHLAVAKLVIALRDLELGLSIHPVFYPPRDVLGEFEKIDWHSKAVIENGMKRYMKNITLKHCARHLENFIDRRCRQLRRYRGMFDLIDFARALGSNKLKPFRIRRVLKLAEYFRVCKSWRENEDVIKSKLEVDFRGTECASKAS